MITITDTSLDKTLKSILQSDLKFRIRNSIWRSGRLILYKQSGFFIELTIQSKKKERFEIPIPYDIKMNQNKISFDYTHSTLVNNDKKHLELIDTFLKSGIKSRFYDTILEIEVIDERKL